MNATPSGWSTCSFKEVAGYDIGRTPARANPDYWDQNGEVVPWVTISDMPAYGIVPATRESTSAAAFEEVFGGKLVPAGTLLMSFKLTIGRVATLGIPAVHNEAIISIYPKTGLDQRFLGYYLSQVDYTQLQDRQIKGNTLNKAKIDRIPVVVPPETEQRLIADTLDAVRFAIRTNGDALTATQTLKRAVAQRVFISEDGWAHERLGDNHLVLSGGTPSRSVPEYWNGGTIPWVKTTEIDYSLITETSEHITQQGLDESAAKMLPSGAVLMAMYGATRGKVATLGIEAASNQACAAIQPQTDALDSRYLYHQLAHRYDELRQLAHGGQQQNLNLDIVRDFPIAYPASLDTQVEVTDLLDALDEKARLHAKRIAILEALFSSLLAAFMRGELKTAP